MFCGEGCRRLNRCFLEECKEENREQKDGFGIMDWFDFGMPGKEWGEYVEEQAEEYRQDGNFIYGRDSVSVVCQYDSTVYRMRSREGAI